MPVVACPKCGSSDVLYSKKRQQYLCEDCQHAFAVAQPAGTRRVFLSYGHDEHSPLALRLKLDLENRGHAVWFDADRLRAGGDWERYIEEGLEWVSERPELGRVVLLMTPHSVRRPDGYCLNEIARALSRRLTVVPVMVVWSEPPLSICRIQWLDMQDCVPIAERGEKYELKLSRLVEALEHDRLDFEGVQARLLKVLEPLPFDADLAQHSQRFTGRTWVFDQIRAWMADPYASRLFWITGKPGVGKTAIAARLCARHREIAAFHLCRYGHTQKADPRRCVLSLAYQLSSQLPDYQARLNSLNLDSLVAESNARTLFDSLIVQPLSASFPRPDRTIVALIDALDEASAGGRNELASFLASEFTKTPDWLRLIITSRPDPEVAWPLQGITPHDLDTSSPLNEQDLREYVVRELQPLGLRKDERQAAVDAILARSEGIFLYVKWVCDELCSGRLSVARADEFPQGLGGIYAQFFERQFSDPTAYEGTIRPALEMVAAAREPLELNLLANLFQWSEHALQRFRRSLGSLFHVLDGFVRPFHQSLFDWLTDPDKAGPYFLSARDGHRRLAEAGWSARGLAADPAHRYSVLHLPHHLVAVGRKEELRRLVSSFEWLSSKLNASGIHDLIADFDLLDEDDPLRVVQQALRLSIHALLSDPAQLSAQLVGRLAGREEPEIRQLVESVRENRPVGWSLLPRAATLRGPDTGVLYSWPAFRELVPCLIAFSDDGRMLTIVESGRATFRRIEDGTEVPPPRASPELLSIASPWQRAVPMAPIRAQLDNLDRYSFEKRWSLNAMHREMSVEVRVHWHREPGAGSRNSGDRYHDHVAQEVFLMRSNVRWRLLLEGAPLPAIAVAVSGNRRFLALVALTGEVFVWDLLASEGPDEAAVWRCPPPVCKCRAASARISALALDHDGSRMAALDENGIVSVVRVEAAKSETAQPLVVSSSPIALVLAPTGDRAVGVDAAQSRLVWNAQTGAMLLHTVQATDLGQLVGVRVTADVRYLLSVAALHDMYDGFEVAAIDVDAGRETIHFETSGPKNDDFGRLPSRCTAAAGTYYAHPIPEGGCIDLHAGGRTPLDVMAMDDARHVSLVSIGEFPGASDWLSVSSDGWQTLVTIPGEDGVTLKFTADDKVSRVARSADGSCVAVGCESGHVHFLELSWRAPERSQIDAALANTVVAIRCAAVRALAESEHAVGDMSRIAQDDADPLVRRTAVTTLNRRKDPAVTAVLRETLRDPVEMVRSAALEALAQQQDFYCLSTSLADTSVSIRRRAAELLGTTGEPTDARRVEPLLNDPDSRVFRAAVTALSELGGIEATALLSRLATDVRPAVRTAAMRGLKSSDDELAVAVLANALTDSDGSVRDCAVSALLERHWSPPTPELAVRFGMARGQAAVCAKIGPAAIPDLCQVVSTPNSPFASTAADALGQLGCASAVPSLIAGMRHASRWHASHIGLALSALADESAVAGLCDAFAVTDENVRTVILSVLGKVASPEAVEFILRHLNDADAAVRVAAASAVAAATAANSTYRGRAIPALLGALAEGNPGASAALGELHELSAIPTLIKLAGSGTKDSRVAAICALGTIGHPDGAPVLVEALLSGACTHETKPLKVAAAEALGKIATPDVRDALLQALEKERVGGDRWHRSSQAIALALTRVVAPEDLVAILARSVLFSAPSSHRNPEFDIELLRVIPRVLTMLLQGRSVCHVEDVVHRLVEAMPVYTDYAREEIADILVKLGPVGVAAIVARLNAPQWKVRLSLVRALGQIASPQAVPALVSALEDADGHVRLAAVHALIGIRRPEAVAALAKPLPSTE